MKILTTKNFNDKLAVLDSTSLDILKNILEKLRLKDSSLNELIISNDVYAVRDSDVTLFYARETNDETLVLLDIIPLRNIVQGSNIFSSSPLQNNSLNPINNKNLNPNFNRALNPIFNRSINPIFNRALNPIFNRSINPIFNRALNPIFNRSINPKLNKAFKGPYLYNLDQNQTGFTIAANEDLSVVFDNEMERIGLIAPIDDQLKAFLGKNNDNNGYFVKASNEVWLQFDKNAKWIGFLTENF